MPHTGRSTALKSAAALALLLAGCGSATRPQPQTHPAAPAGPVAVAISGYAFHPHVLTVPAGTAVTFVNHDQTAHTATASHQPGAFDTGTLGAGQSKRIILSKPGSYTYYCQFHAFMRATITVTRH